MEYIRQVDQTLLELEDKYYDMYGAIKWTKTVIPHVAVISILYVFLAHWGVRQMEKREKFSLRRPLVCWNVGLAWYSIFSFYRFWPEMIGEKNPADRICSVDYMGRSGGMWGFIFALSKFAELGDTVFVVLKKKKLIFLHWFHHLTVLLFCVFSFMYPHGPGRIFAMVNMVVHALMYSYYAVVAMGYWRLPRWINMTITTLQLSQMGIGAAATIWAFHRRKSGLDCTLSDTQFAVCMLLYGCYGILFGNFFYQTYLRRSPKKQKEVQMSSGKSISKSD